MNHRNDTVMPVRASQPIRLAQVIVRVIMIVPAVFAFAFAFASAPLAAFAEPGHAGAPAAETVTVQLDITAPTGTAVAGTVVIRRTPGSGQADILFRGTINGQPADATAQANENWSDNSHGSVEITRITSWHAPVPRPTTMTLQLAQVGPGLITINGIPLATSAPLAAPGSGDHTYVATNPGKGEAGISLLPRTGVGQLTNDPLLVAAAMVTAGPFLVVCGMLVRRLARRSRLGRANAAG